VGILQQSVNLPKAALPPVQPPGNYRESPKINRFLDDYTVGSSGNDFTVYAWQFNII
jgi:hypothetical protein